MVVVRDPHMERIGTGRIALYARVSSADQQSDLERQVHRLRDYAAARGHQVAQEVREIASGLNESRPKFLKLLADPRSERLLSSTKTEVPVLDGPISRRCWKHMDAG